MQSTQHPETYHTGGARLFQLRRSLKFRPELGLRPASIRGDGNTAIVGGAGDNNSVGAAWIFIRNAGSWTQQGPKLIGSGAAKAGFQGASVALSGDGKTATVGGIGIGDNGYPAAAAWVFTRNGGTWTQQGRSLVGSDAVGPYVAIQGGSVALSEDGNTAVLGGINDDSFIGATWVFTRNGSAWTQQGPKLVGTGAVGEAHGYVEQAFPWRYQGTETLPS